MAWQKSYHWSWNWPKVRKTPAMLVIFRELTERFTCVQVQAYTGVCRHFWQREMNVREYRLDYICRKSGEHTGEGEMSVLWTKLWFDDELLLILNTKWSFAMPFQNQTLELCLCQAAMQLSHGFYSTWILCLYFTFEEIPICLHDMHMPSCLSEKYPARAVHDAAKFQMEKPSDLDAQAATWSH